MGGFETRPYICARCSFRALHPGANRRICAVGLDRFVLYGRQSDGELQRFASLWQERVKGMLVDHAARLVQVSAWTPG